MDYVVCTNHDLRMACIDNHWFTAGSNFQYDRLLEMTSDSRNFRLKEISAVIYICSEKSYAEIFEKLLKLQCSYMYNMTGERINVT